MKDFVVVSALLFLACSGTTPPDCTSFMTCGDCIRAVGCVWCKNPKFLEAGNPYRNYVRCNTLEEHEKLGICDSQFLENPQPNYLKIEEAVPEKRNSNPRVILKPSSASLRMRIGYPINITMEYYDAENKALDLYYVMDLSATMADDREMVATLGTSLVSKIQNLTSDVKIGFGSFIDKPIAPFASLADLKKQETNTTTIPYGFKNHLSLTTDINRFQEEVRKSKTSGNLDAPEGVMDAVMQAVACTDVIGWRPTAQHLLIVSTDGPFHIAGDAKLAGILKPSDSACHMTKEGNIFTKSTTFDYPSIAQVNSKVKEENVFVIFAVTEEYVPLYELLSKRIVGSATRALEDDSDNVVELVEQEYKKIITSIELPKLPPHISKYLRLTYYAKCGDNVPYIKSNRCHDMKLGSNATFQIEMEVLKCPRNEKDRDLNVVISPLGIPERLVLNVKLICDCSCESEIDEGYKEKDAICHGKGAPRCGSCACNEGYAGKNCECSSHGGSESYYTDDSGCQIGNSSSTCSNRGICICGKCLCNQNQLGERAYSGTYCECDDSNCPLGDNGLMCSGQGTCRCSKCICAPGFVGESCMCSTSEENCREPEEESICSGRGYCKCGACVCESPYTGRFCQNCLNCPGKCEDPTLTACISCYLEKLHRNPTRECHECDYLSKIESSDEIYEESDEEKSCFFRDGNGCQSSYVYSFHDRNKMRVRVERILHCPNEVPIAWIAIGIVGTVVLGGATILLSWKFVTYFHDMREWKKFKNEIQSAKWSSTVNPIYKGATSTYQNPIYNRNHKI